jgi:hypothetical protein
VPPLARGSFRRFPWLDYVLLLVVYLRQLHHPNEVVWVMLPVAAHQKQSVTTTTNVSAAGKLLHESIDSWTDVHRR